MQSDVGEEGAHDYSGGLMVGSSVVLGFVAFFCLDKIIRALSGGHHHHHHGDDDKHQHEHSHGSTGYLTVIANILHTMTDGLTLAIAHFTSPAIAFSTTLAVFLHEVPHKIGDYAVMRKSGFSKTKSILMQFVLVLGSFLGVGLGIWLNTESEESVAAVKGEIDHIQTWLIPASAGGLLYTATVGIIPELLESKGFFSFVFSVNSMLSGLAFMAFVAMGE
jgi:zinc transporter 7